MRNLGSLAIITNQKGEYLLQLRDGNAPTSPDRWGFFGGHKEGEETPLETLIRELKEEIGLSFLPERFVYVDTIGESEEESLLVSLYRLSLDEEEEKGIQLGEGAGYRFFPLKEDILDLPMSPRQRGFFQKLLWK